MRTKPISRMISALIVVFTAFPACGWAQEPQLNMSQGEVVMFEPLFLQVTYQCDPTPEELPSFVLLINGKELDDPMGSSFESPVFLSDGGRGIGTARTFKWYLHLHLTSRGYVFSDPGEYVLVARDRKSGAKSKELRVAIKEASESDRAVGEALIAFYLSQRSREEKESELREVVSKYPKSRIARYAKYQLSEIDFDRAPTLKSNSPEELAKLKAAYLDLLTRYAELASELPAPSVWHCIAAKRLANCRSGTGDFANARFEVIKLEEIYGKHPEFGPGLRSLIESLEKAMGWR